MRKFFITLWIIFFAAASIGAQDRVVTAKIIYDSIPCRILSVLDSSIIYSVPGADAIDTIAFDKLAGCLFFTDKDVLVRPKLIFDTLLGTIVKIGNSKVKVNAKDGLSGSIPKHDIFICQFSESPYQKEIEVFRKKYQNLQYSVIRLKINKVVTTKGTEIKGRLINIDQDSIVVLVYHPRRPAVRAPSGKEDTKSVIFNDFYIDKEKSYAANYLLTDQGNLFRARLKDIDSTMVGISMRNGSSMTRLEESKDKISGIFFNNYTAAPKDNVRFQKHDYSPLELAIGIGYANQFALPDDIGDKSTANYYRKTANGLYVNAAINFFLYKNFGWGIYYKYFRTSGTMNVYGTNIISKIHSNFIGLSLLYKARLSNFMNYELIASPGILLYRDKLETAYDKAKISGEVFGLNVSNRFGLAKKHGVGVFLEISYLYCILNSWYVEDVMASNTDHLNISRIEIGIGLTWLK